ncbi:hypothetical protein [Pinisolibacter sp.]|uniref:hypothetical protein n=1 Tax=Pinisolibacter sp. TaxID=2172024 RepID=UPI002FDE23E1
MSPTTPRLLPSAVLREIRRMLEVEIVAQPAIGTIEIARSGIVLAIAALADVASEVEVLEESRDVADRLCRELAIARAEIERLQLQLVARDLVDGPRMRVRVPRIGRPCEIVDIRSALPGQQVGRQIGPEGGAA